MGKGSKNAQSRKEIHHTEHTEAQREGQLDNQEEEYRLFTCTNRINPYVVELCINTKPVWEVLYKVGSQSCICH